MKGKTDVNALVNQRAPMGQMKQANHRKFAVGLPGLDELALIGADKIGVTQLQAEVEGVMGGDTLGRIKLGYQRTRFIAQVVL
jgi:hypothetical protein